MDACRHSRGDGNLSVAITSLFDTWPTIGFKHSLQNDHSTCSTDGWS